MRILTFCTLLIAAAANQSQATSPVSDSHYDLAITNVTAIDAVEGVRAGYTVLIKDGHIQQVLADDDANFTAAARIDGTDRYLIPGLWDMHVHITYEPKLVELMPKLFLDYGVTSVRDTGGLLRNLTPHIERWRDPEFEAPHVYFSGPLLDGKKIVYDGVGRPEIGIGNPDTATAAANIEALRQAGADFVKIYELVSPDVFAALVGAAKAADLPIAAHVPLSMSAEVAGPDVDSIEHLRNIELACSNQAEALLAERTVLITSPGKLTGYELRSRLHSEQRPRALADIDLSSERCQRVIASLRDTVQVPTLRLNTISAFSPAARDDWNRHLKQLPAGLRREWRRTAKYFAKRASDESLRFAEWSLQLVEAMRASGVPIGAGTDTPIAQAIPGYSLHTELERLVEAGLSPMDALRAATVRPAEFLSIEGDNGRIASGMQADLVLLEADPLTDIRNTRSIAVVVLQGSVVRQK